MAPPGQGDSRCKARSTSRSRSFRRLREADAMLSAEKSPGQVCQALEISEQTFHRCRNQYGGMKSEEAKRLKELEEENRRLKKVVANLTLDKDILQEPLRGND
jgi:putative transposase